MNPFRRFLDFISYPSHSRTIGFLAFLVILLAVPLTVNIAQKQQELRQHAAFTFCSQGSVADDGNCYNDPSTKTGYDGPATEAVGGTPTSGNTSSTDAYNSACYSPSQAAQHPECTDTGASCNSGRGTYYKCPFCLFGVIGSCSQKTTTNPAPTASTTPGQPGTSATSACEKAGGQCVDQGYAQSHAGFVRNDLACYSGDLFCFIPSATGGTSGNTGTTGTTGTNTCTGSCLWTNIQTCEQAEGFGNCSVIPGQSCGDAHACIQINAGTGGTCTLSSAGVYDYKCDCTTGDGQQGHHAIKVCTAGGTATDPTCYAGTSVCGSGGGSTPTTTPASTSAPTSSGCNASQGFINSCQGIAVGTSQNNPAQCTQANGQFGFSVMQCQSNNCWYDSYYDQNPAKAPKTQWCYPKGTLITFAVGLDGIGQTGDQKNPNPNPISSQSRGSNQSPKRTSRPFFYQVFDSAGTTEQTNGQGSITYDSGSGKYKASATLSKTLADGTYLLKIRVQGHLAKIVRGVTISGGIAQVPNTNLVNGDTNGDNHLKIDDYNLILSCVFKPMTTACAPADLDDNGVVDQFDYNLFIREFAVVQDGE